MIDYPLHLSRITSIRCYASIKEKVVISLIYKLISPNSKDRVLHPYTLRESLIKLDFTR